MKRRLLMTMMAMVLAFSFTGCGNKKADETTATTEAASEVKDEFIKFVGTDIPKMDTEEAEIMKKFKRAVTDSEARVYYGENKAGINNLMGIYSCITGKSYDEIEKEFEGRGYGDFKTAVGEAVVKELEPIQARYNELIKDKAYLEKCYSEAAPRAEAIARRTLQKVMKKVGYLPVAH